MYGFFTNADLSYTVDVHTFKQVYYTYFDSKMSSGFIFWDSFSDSSKVFVMKKKVLRLIITKSAYKDSAEIPFFKRS